MTAQDLNKNEPIILDATGKSLGRIASLAASHLRGKLRPQYERHLKPDNKVVIINVSKVRITGNKLKERTYERYSGYPGGLKRIPYEKVFKKDPRELMKRVVSGMIPRNRLRKHVLKNLEIHV